MTSENERRPADNGAALKKAEQPGDTLPHTEFSATLSAARYWVAWTARRRWPDCPANDAVWAVSVASWECGGREVAA